MPGTVEDFMRRFGGGGAVDDREAEQYYDRFASTHADDREFDTDTMAQGTTEYLGPYPMSTSNKPPTRRSRKHHLRSGRGC